MEPKAEVKLGRTASGLPRLRAIVPWPTYRVDELSAPPTLAASSSHSPTGPPLATEPFLLLVAGPQVWNSLPSEVTSAPSLDIFRRRLETHLFTVSYSNI